jgi:hypothetical protein
MVLAGEVAFVSPVLIMLANVAKPYGSFDAIGYVGIVLLLLAASIAIWKWAERYKTDLARFAAALMIAALWIGISRPITDSHPARSRPDAGGAVGVQSSPAAGARRLVRVRRAARRAA